MTLIKSMTGYGRAVKTLLGREFTVELRAVNNRYLDCTVKLPRSLTFAEEGVKQRVKAAVARGKVDVLISVGAAAGEPVQVSLNRPVLEGYLQAMNAMVQEYGVHNDISAAALAWLPEVFLVEKPKEDEDELLSALLQVDERLLAAFNAMRAAEGAAMEADLQSRGQTILNLVAQVEAGRPRRWPTTGPGWRPRCRRFWSGRPFDESRILQEAAMFADKVAVDEETVRLRSHLSQMQAMLSGGGAIGRKLDFLLQEMNREANTIGSKCTDLALARVVVEIKAELEKIREQAQNIE